MQKNIPTSLNSTGDSKSIHSNQIPTHSPKFKKNIFLLFFLLVLLVFIIFYIKGSNYINLYNKSTLKTSPSPLIYLSSPTPSEDETANWEIYTNTKYKYLIKYPPEYKPQVTAPGVGNIPADDKVGSLIIGPISISGFEFPPRAYIFQKWTKSEVIINGFAGTKYVKEKVKATLQPQKDIIDGSLILYPEGTVTYIFKHPTEEIYLQIFTQNDQILSTFRFLDGTSSSPNSNIGVGCRVGGCSSELCMSKDSENAASICLYSPKFECYKTAVCEIQQNGECGWTQSDELISCLEKY